MTVNLAYEEKSWYAERRCSSTASNFSEAVNLMLCLQLFRCKLKGLSNLLM